MSRTSRPRRRARPLALALALAATAAVPLTFPGPTAAAPAAPTAQVLPAVTVRTPTADDPLRVTLFGDSIMDTGAPGIDAALGSTGVARVINRTVGAFGLTSLFDWRTEWPKVLAAERPDVIVLMFGGWDADTIRFAGGAYYERVVEEAITMMAATGALIVFVGTPTTGAIFGAEPVRRLVNGFFQRAAAAHPGVVAYLAPEPILDDPLQNFRSFAQAPDGRWERIRKDGDDVHLCAAGAALLGAGLVDGLRGLGVALPPLPANDWQHGDWTAAEIYAVPVGGCPPAPDPMLASPPLDSPAR
jgi:hypothetical protein